MHSAGEIPSDRSIDVATLYAIGECTLEVLHVHYAMDKSKQTNAWQCKEPQFAQTTVDSIKSIHALSLNQY